MLNTANIVSPALVAPIPARPGGIPSAAEESPPFAQVLGQASAQQHTAVRDQEPQGGAKPAADAAGSDTSAPPSASERRGIAGQRAKVPGQAVAHEAKARRQAATDLAAEATDPASAPQAQLAPLDVDDARPSAQEAQVDLVSRLPDSPLPPAPEGVAASPSSRCAEARTPPGQAIAAATETMQRPAQRALDVLTRPDGALPDAPAQAQAVGARPQAARTHGREERGAAGDAVSPRDMAAPSRSAFEGALQATAPARASLPADSATAAGGHPATVLPTAPWSAITTPSVAAPAPLQADLGVAPGSREFAPALGAQLAVLVRDGVEHAQLRLHPAELGPIDIRISVDGMQAQVDFAAAHATTRHALQDAVPALAGALRESGLTLSGGGVFEQPREQRGDTHADGPRGDARPTGRALDGTSDNGVTAALAARLPRARGVVDLYA